MDNQMDNQIDNEIKNTELLDLPIEMLEHIFSFLSDKDILKIRQTCTLFNNIKLVRYRSYNMMPYFISIPVIKSNYLSQLANNFGYEKVFIPLSRICRHWSEIPSDNEMFSMIKKKHTYNEIFGVIKKMYPDLQNNFNINKLTYIHFQIRLNKCFHLYPLYSNIDNIIEKENSGNVSFKRITYDGKDSFTFISKYNVFDTSKQELEDKYGFMFEKKDDRIKLCMDLSKRKLLLKSIRCKQEPKKFCYKMTIYNS
jgi:hypothetical protein